MSGTISATGSSITSDDWALVARGCTQKAPNRRKLLILLWRRGWDSDLGPLYRPRRYVALRLSDPPSSVVPGSGQTISSNA